MADAPIPPDFERLFGELFKELGPNGKLSDIGLASRNGKIGLASDDTGRGTDLVDSLILSPREAREGARKKITIQRRVLCEACAGSGRDPAAPQCDACGGSRFLTAKVEKVPMTISRPNQPCAKCKGRGHDERYDCGACDNGTGLAVSTSNLTVTVPPGSEDGQRLRLQGRGDERRDGVTGDLYIGLVIDGPSIEATAYRGVTAETLAAENAAQERHDASAKRSRLVFGELGEGERPRSVGMLILGLVVFAIVVSLFAFR